jgi:hypothetical protein
VIWPGEIVSAARFMVMKLLPQTRPRTAKATVAGLRMARGVAAAQAGFVAAIIRL